MNFKTFLLLSACVVVCLLAGIIGSVFTAQSIPTWYAGLNKPPLNPPNWIFAPVWTTLYLLMGIAIFLIVKNGFGAQGVKAAVWVFAAQLILNTLWSIIFFGMRSTLGGLPIILALWALILACIIMFYAISKPASFLMIPYILWVSFATYLNTMLYLLNR